MKQTQRFTRFSVTRSLAVGLGGLALVVVAWHAMAGATVSLHIERNAGGTIIQSIPVESWSYDNKQGVLRVATVGGRRECVGAVTNKTRRGKTLVLDGTTYSLDAMDIQSRGGRVLTVRPASRKLFPLCLRGATALADVSRSKGASGLAFEVDALTPGGTIANHSVPVVGTINYDIFGGRIQLTTGSDVLCLQGGGPGAGVALELTDTNGQVQTLSGLDEIAYFPFAASGTAARTLRARTGPNQFCAQIPNGEAVTLGAGVFPCARANRFFNDGFEDAGGGVPSGADLQVDLRLLQNPNETTNDGAIYQLHVQNCGSAVANNVVVRDFFPAGMSTPSLNFASNWACISGGETCSGSGYIQQTFASIDPGQVIVIEANRGFLSGTDGQVIKVTGAAVIPGTSDANPTNNVKSWQFDVQANMAPQVSITGATCAVDEDTPGNLIGAAAVCALTISASDADGTVADITVTAATGAVLSVTNVQLDANNTNVTQLSVTPVLNQFGSETLHVVATDNLGSTSAVAAFDVTVNPVNDPPVITVLGGFDYNDGTPLFVGNCTDSSPVGCADQMYPATINGAGGYNASFAGWVVSVSPGPANENGQSVSSPNVTLVSDANPSLFFSAPFEPKLTGAGMQDLNYGLNGNSGSATVTIDVDDGQVSNSTASISFEIVVANSPPVVAAGQNFNQDEHGAAMSLVGVINGSDAEMNDLQGWQITAGNVDLDGDTNLPFAIADASTTSAQLTVNDPDDLDFEQVTSFNLSVIVSDGNGTSAAETVTVALNDLNDNLPVIASGLFSTAINENSTPSTLVGTVTATDNDAGTTLQNWTIVSGNDDGPDADTNPPFVIDASSGVIRVNDGSELNYELTPSFNLMLTVSDGANTSIAELVVVDLINVNDNIPTVNAGQMFSIDENSPVLTSVGTLMGADGDNDTLQDWEIVSGNDDVDGDSNPAFAIDSASGEITVNDMQDVDWDLQTSFTLTVRVGDGVFTSATDTVTIDVNDLGD